MKLFFIYAMVFCFVCQFFPVLGQSVPSYELLLKEIENFANYELDTYDLAKSEIMINEYLVKNDLSLTTIEKVKIYNLAGDLFDQHAHSKYKDKAKTILYSKKAIEVAGFQFSDEIIECYLKVAMNLDRKEHKESIKQLVGFNGVLNWLRLMPKEQLRKYVLFSSIGEKQEQELLKFSERINSAYNTTSYIISSFLNEEPEGDNLAISYFLPMKYYVEKKLNIKIQAEPENKKNEKPNENKKIEEKKVIPPLVESNFHFVGKLDSLKTDTLTKENLNKIADYLKDERFVGTEGIQKPEGLDYLNKKRICDFATTAFECFISGDSSSWHQKNTKTKNLQPALENCRAKMEKYQKLSIQEIGVLEISAAVNEKKYGTDEDWVKLSRLLVRWLHYDFEFYNRAAYQNVDRELMLNEIRKWWGENKSLDKDAWVKNAELMRNSELYTKIRTECLALGEKRAKEWQEKRKKEVETFKQNDPEFLTELEKLGKTTGTKEGKEKAIEWLEKNKSKLAGTTLEAEMTQFLKRLKDEILEETNP